LPVPPRDPFGAPEVQSRRTRPAKPPLSRDAIVEEALRQITAEDGGAMSLRKIAKALDTGPASLYAYVNDLTELQALVLDRALEAVKVDGERAHGATGSKNSSAPTPKSWWAARLSP
jgi:AcrR family transcriptional regulator